ncbi:arylsulfatase [Alphaproteobacteria bacterium 46_93_T64]|nr:arylsulfatase [Alphaproteobacteria bacterium 46_93_T64]
MSETAKNVIVFFTDQQRWDSSAIFGNPLDLTPNFDTAAMAGTHLYNCFTNQPVCGPARSMMQTGLYPTTTGCYRNNIPLPKDSATLGSLFRKSGFKTGYVGKWHLGTQDPVPEPERGGYEYWLASNMLEYTSDAYDTTLYDNDGKAQKLPGYRVDALTDAAIRYIDGVKDDRFFLFLSFLEPHHQNHLDNYPGRVGDEQRYAGRWMPPDLQALGGSAAQHLPGYFGMIKRLDDAFGRIQDALLTLGISEETTILYTSDHGSHFKTRNAEYKRSCHDACVRIPGALIGGPFTGGGRVTNLVSTIDIAPTLLDAAGLDIPDNFEGNSLLPVVNRTSTDWPEDVFIQISEDHVGRAVRTKRWKYGVRAPNADGWNDLGADQYEEEYLYDLHADPYELTNLIGMDAFADVSTELRAKLVKQTKSVENRTVDIVKAPEISAGQRSSSVWAGWHGHR